MSFQKIQLEHTYCFNGAKVLQQPVSTQLTVFLTIIKPKLQNMQAMLIEVFFMLLFPVFSSSLPKK